jgi:hypothetical protein
MRLLQEAIEAALDINAHVIAERFTLESRRMSCERVLP